MIEVRAIETVIGMIKPRRNTSMNLLGLRTSMARAKAQQIWNGLMIRLKIRVTRIVFQNEGSSISSA